MRYQSSSSCGVGFVCNVQGQKSRQIVSMGIEAVRNLTHRGAVGADGKSGDGAGVMTRIPRKFFSGKIDELGFSISDINNLAIGTFFLYGNVETQISEIIDSFGLSTIGWRDVPIDDDALGKAALVAKPRIKQLLIDTEKILEHERELTLFVARKAIEKKYNDKVCIVSISSGTIIYKGLLVAPQLDTFYKDLKDPDFESAFCIFHQRFSTNTLPVWIMAQPFRVLAHNGEINTLQGNRNWIAVLEEDVLKGFCENHKEIIKPLIEADESDSASLDKIVELLILAGFSPEHAINLCIPPAWEGTEFDPDLRSFWDYASLLMTPWDGPAAIVFSDGKTVGAHLDRNGLRPLRYVLSEDGILVIGSEVGMVDLGDSKISEKGRLGPGDTISVNTETGRIKKTAEILKELASRKPYREWLDQNLLRHPQNISAAVERDPEIIRKQAAFGYSSEEIQMLIKPMAETGRELTFSMGDDTPIPPLSDKPQLLFRYFKQRFSQITNPSIDPIRENLVMSLSVNLGPRGSYLMEIPERARRLNLMSPLLWQSDLAEIENSKKFRTGRVAITYGKHNTLEKAVDALQNDVLAAANQGCEIIILSDKDISAERAAVPSLLAVAASVSVLSGNNLSHKVSLIAETGEARDVHHIACLIGFGASAICPYLLLGTVSDLCEKGELGIRFEEAASNIRIALESGLLKVLARLGISTLSSYHGGQLFDSLGLRGDFLKKYFGDIFASAEADGIEQIGDSVLKRHQSAFEVPEAALDYGGSLRYKKEGEWHAWGASSLISLVKFAKSFDEKDYRAFSAAANNRPVYLRHLLGYRKGTAIPLDQVEPEDEILKRLVSGAMSVGALSPEAHETIAEACNRLGMRSNSGEGGEDPERLWTIKNSAIKQVASGRFGVTPVYLASAREIEIKVAQGAKPGEGGHLPANKVTEYIAGLRYCKPGTLLISPPPHHDIYSIEDLNQLIHDLKQANPEAKICVKLVSEIGVGTVAAGVAKAYADIVQISGYEGGTGAAPITSIKNVGNCWETGLSETQRVLIENGLRERIRVRVDGGMKTGKDVIIAALFGAEEFGFGTATMIAAGCVMARQCHLNNCPTGIATQDERLRAKYKGKIEGVMSFFRAIAREVREILSEMGFRSMDEIIGRTDLLAIKVNENFAGSRRVDIGSFIKRPPEGSILKSNVARNDNPARTLNEEIIAEVLPYIEKRMPVKKEYAIRNIDRSIPVRLNYHIAKIHGATGLAPDTITLMFNGTAGQSFGAFNHKGLTLILKGDANDYAGKGMHGGKIVIRPSDNIREAHKHVIAGNTVLYGATGGEFFACGIAGERFAVRNSGAVAVLEGAGRHLCEYMTRGEVLCLGEAGLNIGAGMTGGVLYIYDSADKVKHHVNAAYVKIDKLHNGDLQRVKTLMDLHFRYTESPLAKKILADFEESSKFFIKVVPVNG